MKWRATFVALAIFGLFYFGPNLPAGKCSSSRRIGRNILQTPEDIAKCEQDKPDCGLSDSEEDKEEFNSQVKAYFKCFDEPESQEVYCDGLVAQKKCEREDTTNWKFTIMVIFITIVVSLLVCLIFDYSKQINQKSEETMKSEIQDRVLHDQDQKMEVIKLGLINTLQKESFDLSKNLKNHIDEKISEIYISTTMASTTSAPNPIIHVKEIEIKFSKMEENMANISRDVKICTKGIPLRMPVGTFLHAGFSAYFFYLEHGKVVNF